HTCAVVRGPPGSTAATGGVATGPTPPSGIPQPATDPRRLPNDDRASGGSRPRPWMSLRGGGLATGGTPAVARPGGPPEAGSGTKDDQRGKQGQRRDRRTYALTCGCGA